MELHVYLAFVTATAIMIALPGPSVILTVAHSISFGWRRAIWTVAGATAGIAVQLTVAAVGLVSLVNAVAWIFEWLRWAGAAYLVYLGVRQWRSAGSPPAFDSQVCETEAPGAHLFFQGMVVTVPNPKSLIFIAAFLPQFMDTARSPALQFALIVPTFLVITFTVTSVWAWAAGHTAGVLRNRRAFKPVFRAAGGLMIVSGVGLALARRGGVSHRRSQRWGRTGADFDAFVRTYYAEKYFARKKTATPARKVMTTPPQVMWTWGT